jgi:hypothetical protein
VAEVFLQWLYEQVFMTVVARINWVDKEPLETAYFTLISITGYKIIFTFAAIWSIKSFSKLGLMVYACNPSTQETDGGGLQITG